MTTIKLIETDNFLVTITPPDFIIYLDVYVHKNPNYSQAKVLNHLVKEQLALNPPSINVSLLAETNQVKHIYEMLLSEILTRKDITILNKQTNKIAEHVYSSPYSKEISKLTISCGLAFVADGIEFWRVDTETIYFQPAIEF